MNCFIYKGFHEVYRMSVGHFCLVFPSCSWTKFSFRTVTFAACVLETKFVNMAIYPGKLSTGSLAAKAVHLHFFLPRLHSTTMLWVKELNVRKEILVHLFFSLPFSFQLGPLLLQSFPAMWIVEENILWNDFINCLVYEDLDKTLSS